MGLEILENHSLFCSSFFCIPIWDVFIGSERERERERADGWLKFQGGICIHFLVNWDHGKTLLHSYMGCFYWVRERERERADGWLKFQGGICIHFLVNWDHGKTFIHIAITLYLNQNTIRLSCFYKYLISYFHLISNP